MNYRTLSSIDTNYNFSCKKEEFKNVATNFFQLKTIGIENIANNLLSIVELL